MAGVFVTFGPAPFEAAGFELALLAGLFIVDVEGGHCFLASWILSMLSCKLRREGLPSRFGS